MDKTLAKQTAIISGGLGDIGRAIATELATRGADVALGDVRSADDANSFTSELKKLGVRAKYDRVDVSDPEQVEKWVGDVEREVAAPTLIIPNAAIVTIAGVRDVTAKQWRREMEINLDGAFHLAQSAAKKLIDTKKPGRIVFIGSWAAHAAHPQIVTYCAAKAGLRMLCKCMALDLAPLGILVNEVAPGYVDAGLTAQFWAKTPGLREKAIGRVPLGIAIEPREVALQVAHLCEPQNRHMTGTTILMDGGLSLVTPARQMDAK